MDSMYRAVIHLDVPVNNNKQILKINVPLNIKYLYMWYMCRGIILANDILAKHIVKEVHIVCFCYHNEAIKHLFFRFKYACYVWSVMQVASNFYLPSSVSFKTGCMALIMYIILLWLCSNDMVIHGKVLILCISSGATGPICGLIFGVWRSITYLWRYVHD
jgi:hypothetical protein